jgi:hypothetical protein
MLLLLYLLVFCAAVRLPLPPAAATNSVRRVDSGGVLFWTKPRITHLSKGDLIRV